MPLRGLFGCGCCCPGQMGRVAAFIRPQHDTLTNKQMSYDAPIGMGVQTMSDLPFKQQMKLQFTDMGKRAWSSAKNFGFIGGVFSGTECCIESLRAKNDLWNGVAAGCLTGGGLAIKAGPQATLVGCAGFAAFSAAIDLYMRSDQKAPPSNDEDL